MTEKTIFQKIIDRELPANIIYEDERHIAFLDIKPFEIGHTLVVPKKPYETIFDMTEKEFTELNQIVYKVARHLRGNLPAEGMNIAQNNYPISGQIVPHVHFHLIPRNKEKNLYNSGQDEKFTKEELNEMEKKLSMLN